VTQISQLEITGLKKYNGLVGGCASYNAAHWPSTVDGVFAKFFVYYGTWLAA
jgi:hypothetical protein